MRRPFRTLKGHLAHRLPALVPAVVTRVAKQLERRSKAAGIEHLFFVWAVTDPGERQRCRIMRYGDRAFGKGSFPDAPGRPLGDEFAAWLAPRVRAALEGRALLGGALRPVLASGKAFDDLDDLVAPEAVVPCVIE